MNVERAQPLFRKEVLERRTTRLQGEVSLAIPMSWQVVGYVLLLTVVAGFAFLALASYSRVETVKGAVVLDTGVATIVPSRAGVISALNVDEGDTVKPGDVLGFIRSEEDTKQGITTPMRVIESLRQQDQGMAFQGSLLLKAAEAEQSRLIAQIEGVTAELASIGRQIADQRLLVSLAESQLNEAKVIAERGFISRRELDNRETNLLSRRQQLSQLEQLRVAKTSVRNETLRTAAEAKAKAQAQAAGLQSNRATLEQQVAQVEAAQGYRLTSPVAGTVTAITANPGQPASPGQPLMMVAPSGAKLRVELEVPTSAIGFLEPGQEVRLAIDSFPYQRFGTVKARIASIARTVIGKSGAHEETTPVYLVNADVEEPSVLAFGRKQPLIPGMTLSARIVTDRRSLLEWLFEPLYAVQRR